MAAKRFPLRLRLGALLLAAGLIAFCAVFLTQREPWHPLASGGEIRLVKVAYGETLEISDGGLKADDLRDWLGPRWSRLLGPYPDSSSSVFGEPTLAFAFSTRGLDGALALQNAQCEIDMRDGQMLLGHFGGGSGVTGGTMTEVATFEITPFSERRLRLRLKVDGQILHFNVSNPIFRNRGAAWKAAPLPQTHTVDGIEITLDRVVGEWAEDHSGSSSWVARADFSVGIDGKAAGDWVNCAATFSDPLGNESSLAVLSTVLFSQPVWKVHCGAWKNERFPFPDSQVTWLGPVTLPGPGEIRVSAADCQFINSRMRSTEGIPRPSTGFPNPFLRLGRARQWRQCGLKKISDNGCILAFRRHGSGIFKHFPNDRSPLTKASVCDFLVSRSGRIRVRGKG